MQTRSWLPTLAVTTNQPFGMHLKHVHVPASSPSLCSLFGPRFFLTPMYESDLDLGLHKRVPFVKCHLKTLFALIHYFCDTIFWIFLAFISLATWCDTFMWLPTPLKEKVMSSSRSTSLICRSSVEFFYGFLGMFHIGFIHPRCLYWMVSFQLN
jgi:hypothetical protein